MKAWWQHYRANLAPHECAALVEYALTFPAQEGKVGHGGTTKTHEMRKSAVRWLARHDTELRWLFDRITLNALEVNRNCFQLDLANEPRLQFGAAQFTEYHADEEGHYDWHEDNCWIAPNPNRKLHDRKLSCVVQLSNPADYEGGRLEFERENLTGDTFTRQGDMIFFPSHLRHRVTPVTRGVRHSLVLWFEGPPLR